MFRKPWMRCLFCLVLVCVLLINCSPIKAQASSLGGAIAIGVGAGLVITGVLIGLGVLPADDTTDFDGLVSSCQDFLTTAGYVLDGMMSVYYLTDPVSYSYAIDQSLIDVIRGWLFDSEIISVKEFLTNSSVEVSADALATASAAPYSFFSYAEYVSGAYAGNSAGYVLCYSYESPIVVTISDSSGNGWVIGCEDSSATIYGYSPYSGTWTSFTGVYSSQNTSKRLVGSTFIGTADPVEYTSSYDLSLAEIAASSSALALGYANWAANSVTVPGSVAGDEDDEDVTAYPIGLGQSYEETRSLTQTDVWAGTSTYTQADSDTETETGTDSVTASGLKGWLDAMLAAIGAWFADVIAGIQAIPEAFSGWFADVITGLQTIGNTITTAWEDAVAAILAGIQSIFVPKEDFLTVKVEALRAEFEFADAIITTGEFIGGSLSGLGTEPPVIYLNLADNRGPYDMGGEVPFIDMRWYAEYKPTADILLSALLWIFFCWRVFVHLPGIISGTAGNFESVMANFRRYNK